MVKCARKTLPPFLGGVVIAFIAALLTAPELGWEVRAGGVVLI
jgi:gas vesicle protein